MAFNFRQSKPATPRAKNELVLSVGSHAYVNWSPSPGQPADVPMRDATGRSVENDLVDGQEVEILSWRPRSREGVAYQICRLSDRSVWWIAAVHLRRLHAALPTANV